MITAGPSILLVRGIAKDGEKDNTEVLFGAYISTPWKSSPKGDRPKNCLH
jgi:hypothetical protein